MEPIILIINGDMTTRAYMMAPGVWFKATAGPNFCEYSWYTGDTWSESRQCSPWPKTPQYARYSADGSFKFAWMELDRGLHRDCAPAAITRAGGIITAEWYQHGKRAPPPSSGPLILYYDPFGNEIGAQDIEKFAREIITPKGYLEVLQSESREKPSAPLQSESRDEISSDAESTDFSDANINMSGPMTFGKLTELVLAKYLLLSMDDPGARPALEMLQFHSEIREVARAVASSGFISERHILEQDFKIIYNIYMAKLAASIPLGGDYSALTRAIRARASILRKYEDYGVDDRDAFFAR